MILPPTIPCGSVLPKISKQHLSQVVKQIWPYQAITYDSEPLNWYHLCELVSSLPLNSWSNILPKKIFMSQSNANRNFCGGPLKPFREFRCIKPCFPTFVAVWQCTVIKQFTFKINPEPKKWTCVVWMTWTLHHYFYDMGDDYLRSETRATKKLDRLDV